MSKIQKPFGRVAKRITIEADDNGTIRVIALDIPLFGLTIQAVQPMDSREMVLALMKVMMDYTSALFSNLNLTKAKQEGSHDEQGSENPDGSDKQPN